MMKEIWKMLLATSQSLVFVSTRTHATKNILVMCVKILQDVVTSRTAKRDVLRHVENCDWNRPQIGIFRDWAQRYKKGKPPQRKHY